MSEQVHDIIVVGGGITGAGVARDAALRGLSVLLLEKRDFASGVSSKTTRLVHGGLRYLANLEVDLVAEALRERSVLRRQCPYLISPMPILIPIYRGDPHGRAAISIGIHLYELLSRERDIPHYFTAGTDRTLSMEPRLNREGLKGSALFYDHQIILPERLVIENIISAREAGAVAVNHREAVAIAEDREGVAVTVRDGFSGAVSVHRGRVLINAGGPWADAVRRAGRVEGPRIIHPTKGIHLVVPKLTDQALFIASRDSRMFFIVPFADQSLIGTTDTVYSGDLDEVHADRDDVQYLLSEASRVLPGMKLAPGSIRYTYAGVRPLAFAGDRESRISRKHRVILEGAFGRIITIAGGKYTTYRSMAEDVVDAACRRLGRRVSCATGTRPLAGSLPCSLDEFLAQEAPRMAAQYRAGEDCVRHLIRYYGARAERVLQIASSDPALAAPVSPLSPDCLAQVVFGIREEGAKDLTDIVLRRMHLGITADRGESRIEQVAAVAAAELKWSNDEKQARIDQFREELRKERRFS